MVHRVGQFHYDTGILPYPRVIVESRNYELSVGYIFFFFLFSIEDLPI